MLSDNELGEIFEACDMAVELNNFKSNIYEYVESRMTFIAPNITAIVGKFLMKLVFFLSSSTMAERCLLLNKHLEIC